MTHTELVDATHRKLLQTIRDTFPDLFSVIVLNWLPEQGEDIYEVLVDDHTIATFDVPRQMDDPVIITGRTSVALYQQSSKKIRSLKLRLALDLALDARKNGKKLSTD
jgi:hypothetical protein